MQVVGMVDDHVVDCSRYSELTTKAAAIPG
jgi:hypothetical protein